VCTAQSHSAHALCLKQFKQCLPGVPLSLDENETPAAFKCGVHKTMPVLPVPPPPPHTPSTESALAVLQTHVDSSQLQGAATASRLSELHPVLPAFSYSY
jgi:hypothetical protein